MNESSDPHSADKILGAESHSPVRDLQAKAWADHSERERLEALWQERDEKGLPMRVRISFETRQDEVMQDSKTASDFERDVETVEEAWAFGYSVAQIHGSLFAGLTQGYQDQQQGEAGDEGEEG